MFPATICGGWTGGPTAAPTASSSRSSRPTPTCGAAWCSIPADRWNSGRTGCRKIEYARRIAGAIGHIALQQGDAVGLSCVAGGIVRNIPPRRNPAHLMAVFDILEQTQAEGRDAARTGAARAGGDDSPAGACASSSRTCSSSRKCCARCFQHLRFRKHDVAVFHLLDPRELGFDFRRPMRFLDMEGGPAIFAEPNEIAERYHKALAATSTGFSQVVLESAVDYHRVTHRRELRTGAHAVPGRPGPVRGGAMSFLQPMLLAALPLVALPIIIHLINQRRYQTIRWAAMMFLLAANRMSRGYARLRQWLIMALRMAAIAGLVFAISRPLAGGWLGLAAGGRADTTIVVLDRSPSMQQAGASGVGSKLETGLPATRANTRDPGLGAVGPDRERDEPPARARVARRRCSPLPVPNRSVLRPTCPPCCWPRATTSGRTSRDGRRSGSAPTSARTTGTPRAAAGRALRDSFSRILPGRPVPPAGLSPDSRRTTWRCG